MNVNFDGRTYSFEVRPGPDGYKQFTEAIRKAFSLPDDSELNITFTCDEPSTGGQPTGSPLNLTHHPLPGSWLQQHVHSRCWFTCYAPGSWPAKMFCWPASLH